MNAVLLNESCVAIGITVSGQTPEVLRALGAAKEKGASTILFTSRSSSDYDAFCDEVLLLAVKEHLKNGGAISPQFPILVMIDVLYSHFSRPTASARRLYMNTPSPNSMKRDPGRGSAYLSFSEETLPRFFSSACSSAFTSPSSPSQASAVRSVFSQAFPARAAE